MGCVIYYLYGETVPALLAEAKLKNGGAAQAIREALIVDNEIIAKFDGTTEIPDHHRELIAIAHAIPGIRIHVADKNWYYQNNNDNYGRVDWVARYNNLVDRMREKMRRELGVVKYVEADERSADSSDGSMEADRANELREV